MARSIFPLAPLNPHRIVESYISATVATFMGRGGSRFFESSERHRCRQAVGWTWRGLVYGEAAGVFYEQGREREVRIEREWSADHERSQ
jgi:hypothetical protein